jgi:drug/metabolite transporter (DMT)-like permease
MLKGPALMLAGIGLFGLLDAISKLLSAEHLVWQVLLVRFATMLAVVLLLRALRPGWGGPLTTRHPRIHLARACAMLGSATFFFLTFSQLPLVEGYLVFFTSPFFVLVLAAVALGERPPRATWGWVAAGFCGVAIGLVPGLANWRTPEPLALALMLGNGIIVGAATAALAEAFRHASASRLAPFGYSGLVWSIAFDLLLWSHLPGWPMLAGAAVVVLACVMSERAAGQNPAGKSCVPSARSGSRVAESTADSGSGP